jgi:hypothetical protein
MAGARLGAAALSHERANWSILASASGVPNSSSPTGKPSRLKPTGTVSAGRPACEPITVLVGKVRH